jgi:hypothetical protein
MDTAYGGIYNTSDRNYTLLLGSGSVITQPSQMPVRNETYSPSNSITITEPGDYLVSYDATSSGSLATSVTIAARKNGTPIDNLSSTKSLSVTGDTEFSGSSIVTLAAGDVLDLYVSSGLAATVTVSNVQLTANMVSTIQQ